MVGEKTGGGSRALGAAPAGSMSLSPRPGAPAPAVRGPAQPKITGRPFLRDRLDDAVRRPPPDADHRPDLDALLVAEARTRWSRRRAVAGGRTLGQANGLRDLDDASAVISVCRCRDARADADEVAARCGGWRAAGGSGTGSRRRVAISRRIGAHRLPARHEVGLELLELARLRVDHALGLVGRHLQRLG